MNDIRLASATYRACNSFSQSEEGYSLPRLETIVTEHLREHPLDHDAKQLLQLCRRTIPRVG